MDLFDGGWRKLGERELQGGKNRKGLGAYFDGRLAKGMRMKYGSGNLALIYLLTIDGFKEIHYYGQNIHFWKFLNIYS